jgi:hypothetical protein
MDPVLLALAAAVLLVGGLACTAWWLVADVLHQRRRAQAVETWLGKDLNHPAHLFCGQSQAVTVAELVERAVRQKEGIQLNWPEEIDEAELVRPYAQDMFPTVILPRVEE